MMRNRAGVVASVFAVTVLLSGWALIPADVSAQRLSQPAIYVLAGGNWHDTEQCADLLIQYLKGRTKFPIGRTLLRNDLKQLESWNAQGLIVMTQGGVLTPAEKQALLSFVRSGKGLVGIHSATDSFDDDGEWEEYTKLLGGWFQKHPARGPYEVFVKDNAHPITRGMKNFTVMNDERYQMKLVPDLNILLTVEVDGEQIANTWTKTYGKGRVFYTGLGHSAETFKNENFLELVRRGIKWAIEDPAKAETASLSLTVSGATPRTERLEKK